MKEKSINIDIIIYMYISQANQVGLFRAEVPFLHVLTDVNIRLHSKYCLTPRPAHLSLRLETLHMLFGKKYFWWENEHENRKKVL